MSVADMVLEDRGTHALKGVPNEWRLFRESALGGPAEIDFLTLSANALGYFLSGRLRFCDDVASRRFAHLVSDGLQLM
jgi:hypothetical protein